MRERIAVLFGIPVSREEFLERAEEASWDYGRRLLAGRRAPLAFEETYAGVCAGAQDVIEMANALGATVCRKVTLAKLGHASRSHDVLILVAHWRGSGVDPDDLLAGWLARLAFAARDDAFREPTEILLRPDLPLGAAIARSPVETMQLRGLTADTLSRLIRSKYFVKWLPGGLGTRVEAGAAVLEALSRDLVDDMLSGAIRFGNQLELWDGLHGVSAVDAALPSSYFGTIDLTCCTSSVLGTYLSVSRDDDIDVIMGDPIIVPSPQLRLIHGILETMLQEPGLHYELARRAIAQGLADWRRSQIR